MTDNDTAPHAAGSPGAPDPSAISRRSAVAGLAVVAGLAAACTRYGGTSTTATGGASTGSGGGGNAGNAGGVLGKTSEVPVGGGVVFAKEQVVVTQPVAGTFKGFSAVCTHQACIVANVTGGTINCTCHGSRFNITDGSVASGPAATPLPARAVTVTGDQITLS